MVSKKVIIGAVAVVAAIAVAAIALGGSSEPEARYNYELSLTDGFTSASGLEYKADAGMQFLVLEFVVYNDSYESGITTNDWIWVWKATCNGLTYSSTSDGMLYPGYQLITVAVGGHGGSVELFEIPADASLDDITISQEYTWTNDPPRLERDTSITI